MKLIIIGILGNHIIIGILIKNIKKNNAMDCNLISNDIKTFNIKYSTN